MTTQSRRMSLVESVANVAVGYVIATAANIIVLPWFGLTVNLVQASAIGLIFTAISIGRSYAVRRAFERLLVVNP